MTQWYSGSLSFTPNSLTLNEGGLCWYSFRSSSSISVSLSVLVPLDGPPPVLAIVSCRTWQALHPSATGNERAIIARLHAGDLRSSPAEGRFCKRAPTWGCGTSDDIICVPGAGGVKTPDTQWDEFSSSTLVGRRYSPA